MTQEALKLALEALEANDQLINGSATAGGLVYCMDGYYSDCFDVDPINKQTDEAIAAIKEALAQQEQEPVAWAVYCDGFIALPSFDSELEARKEMQRRNRKFPHNKRKVKALYDSSPQRTWVDLTRTQMQDVYFAVLEEHRGGHQMEGQLAFGEALQARLKERNT